MNAGRNTNIPAPHPPIDHQREELGHEAADAEAMFMAYIVAHGIPLADLEE